MHTSIKYTYGLGAGWKTILLGVGVSTEQVLRLAQLPEDRLEGDNIQLDASEFFQFAHALNRLLPDVGSWVELVQAMRPEYFSPSIFAALCSPDLRCAVQRLSLFKPLLGPLQLHIDEDAKCLGLEYDWSGGPHHIPVNMHAFEALFIVHLARLGIREEIKPVQVILPEIPVNKKKLEDFIGVEITLGDVLKVVFAMEDARRPFVTSNHEMWSIFEPALRKRLADLEDNATFAEQTRAVLLENIPSGLVTTEQVAQRLTVSSRTLQRRLREEGTNFKDILQSTREHLARYYLKQTEITSSEIAYLLGFDEPTSFFRAFRLWTGTSPDRLRRQMEHEQRGSAC